MVPVLAGESFRPHAIAKATTQPMKVHPKNRLTTIVDPLFGIFLVTATIDGTKYGTASTRSMKNSGPMDSEDTTSAS